MKNNKLYAFILSLLVGFISLSSEILWVRVVSYTFKSLPQAFSFVLILFLLGIAFGSYYGKDYCKDKQNDLYKISFYILLISSVSDIIFLYIALSINNSSLIIIFFLAIFLSAFLKSMIFPIAHHLGTKSIKIGTSVSFIYFGNILGATLGPIITGFIFLEYLTTINTFILLSLITIAIAIFSYSLIKIKNKKEIIFIISISLLIIIFINILNNKKLSLLISSEASTFYVENRHGIIDVFQNKNKDRIVYGSGMYDGAINTDLHHDINGIKRAYKIATFKNPLENILVIGLSTASWVKVISTIPSIKNITVVEINPGYIELIKKYELKTLLNNPKINFISDDGRRWLKRNPSKKFDAIIMNTTWHFRNNTSNLLSKQFLELAKRNLIKDGFIYYNSTFSLEAFKTATLLFNNVHRYFNFIIASNIDVNLSKNLSINKLLALRDEKNQNIFDPSNKKDMDAINNLLNIPLETFNEALKKENIETLIIEDKDPVNEYKRGYFYYLSKNKEK